VASAEEVIALLDSSKLATAHGVKSFASLDDVDQILVDELAPQEHVDQLLAAGVPVAVCGDGRAALLRGDRASKRRLRIGFANLTEDHPFPFAVRQGLERAVAGVADVDLLVADNAMNGPTALKNVDYFVGEGVDVMIEYQYHADYGAVIMSKFRAAAIPVIAVDVPLPGATYFGVDNYVAGQIGGDAAADAAITRWGDAVDRVVSLDLGAAGRTPAARMQGQLDALRARIAVGDEQVVHIDTGISRADTQIAVADMLHAFPEQSRVVFLAGTDEAALGAIDAIRQAGSSDLSVVVSQGADAGARAEMLTPGSPLVGAVSYVPERYGPRLLELAMAIVAREPVPPAVYISHELVTAASIRSGAHDWLSALSARNGRGEEVGSSSAVPSGSSGRREAREPVTSTS
jgi:ribose transport system substrate-binding protein